MGIFIRVLIMYMLWIDGSIFAVSFDNDDMQKLIAITLNRGGDMSAILLKLLTEKLDDEYENL